MCCLLQTFAVDLRVRVLSKSITHLTLNCFVPTSTQSILNFRVKSCCHHFYNRSLKVTRQQNVFYCVPGTVVKTLFAFLLELGLYFLDTPIAKLLCLLAYFALSGKTTAHSLLLDRRITQPSLV